MVLVTMDLYSESCLEEKEIMNLLNLEVDILKPKVNPLKMIKLKTMVSIGPGYGLLMISALDG